MKSQQEFTRVLNAYTTQKGQRFADLSAAAPVLLIFLRHLSCPFCRRVLRDVAALRPEIEKRGIAIAFVHMATESEAYPLFDYFKLADLPRFSDRHRKLYRLAGLRNLRFRSLFDSTIVRSSVQLTRELRQAPQARGGSLLQMPGVFLIDQGHVLAGESVLDFDGGFDWLSLLNAA